MCPEPELRLEQDVPVCEVDCVNEEAVNQIKSLLHSVPDMVPIFKALADETRAKIVYALYESELCVCDVAAVIGASKATASYHLRLLSHMGLAKYRREGKLVFYRLSDSHIKNLIREILHHMDERQRGDAE